MITGLETGKYVHKYLKGNVSITEQCVNLQKSNVNTMTAFISVDNDIREVPKQCLLKC